MHERPESGCALGSGVHKSQLEIQIQVLVKDHGFTFLAVFWVLKILVVHSKNFRENLWMDY